MACAHIAVLQASSASALEVAMDRVFKLSDHWLSVLLDDGDLALVRLDSALGHLRCTEDRCKIGVGTGQCAHVQACMRHLGTVGWSTDITVSTQCSHFSVWRWHVRMYVPDRRLSSAHAGMNHSDSEGPHDSDADDSRRVDLDSDAADSDADETLGDEVRARRAHGVTPRKRNIIANGYLGANLAHGALSGYYLAGRALCGWPLAFSWPVARL